MYVGIGIVLMVLGAILSFGVKHAVSGLDLAVIGYILMAGGALAIGLSLAMARRKTRTMTSTMVTPTGTERVTEGELPPRV